MHTYNKDNSKHRILLGELKHHIYLVKRVEIPTADTGGRIKIEFQNYDSILCEWTQMKPIEIVDGATGVPAKYIVNARIRIPYRTDIKTQDYFIKDDDNILYKIDMMVDETKDKKMLTLLLKQWEGYFE